MTREPEALGALLLRLEEGDLTPEERASLEERMAADAGLADAVVAHHLLSSAIATELDVVQVRARAARVLGGEAPAGPLAPRRRARRLTVAAAATLVAAAAMAGLLAIRAPEDRRAARLATETPPARGVVGGAAIPDPDAEIRGATPPAAKRRGPGDGLEGREGRAPEPLGALGGARGATPATSPSELDLLRSMPRDILLALNKDEPDEEGFSVVWRLGDRCVGVQRSILRGIVVGAALSRASLVDVAWRGVEAALRASDAEWGIPGNINCAAYFLCDLGHAVLVLRDSELWPEYEGRVLALRPRLASVTRHLSDQIAGVRRQQARSPSGLAYYAGAFGFMGILLDDDRLKAHGSELAELAIAASRPDGAFATFGGSDSGYQGNVLYRLSWYALRFPDERLDDALLRGGRWQMGRIDGQSRLDVRGNTRTRDCAGVTRDPCFSVNFDEVVWGLLYHGARFAPEALATARKVHETRVAVSAP